MRLAEGRIGPREEHLSGKSIGCYPRLRVDTSRVAAAGHAGGVLLTETGRRVLVRADGAGATHAFLDWLHGQRLGYSVGFTLPSKVEPALARIPASAWTERRNLDRHNRPLVMIPRVRLPGSG